MTPITKEFVRKHQIINFHLGGLVHIGVSLNNVLTRGLLVFLAAMLTLSACKKDDEIKPNPEPGSKPKVTANAGADKSTKLGQVITLDGSASKDSQGKTLEYTWTLVKSPANSSVTFTYPQPGQATFTTNLVGEYEIELTVKSVNGQAKDKVLITVTPADLLTLSGEINTDRVLENINPEPDKPDYLVTDNIILKAKLTVKPGVVIEFEQDKGLHIMPQGALIAKGTMAERITFTGKQKSAGFWKGILFESNNALNELEYVTVVYGGSSSYAQLLSDTKANVALANTALTASSLKATHTNFAFSGGYGLFVQGMSDITGFSTNVFSKNTGGAIYVPARQLHKLDNASFFAGNNGIDGVETSGTLNHTSEVTWPDLTDGSTYYVTSDITVQSGLKIAEGATLEFREGLALRVEGAGYLNATGTANNKITFTARTKIGQLNWGGIVFSSAHAQNRLQYTEVSYAGNKTIPGFGELKTNIAVTTTGKAHIGQSSITNGLGWGIVAYMNEGAQINTEVVSANTYSNLPSGNTKLSSVTEPVPTLAGVWLDEWSFNHKYSFDEKYYDRQANRWFRGAASPWTMNPKAGFGLKINEDGSYIWTIAKQGPESCANSYSAEYILGNITSSGDMLTFQELSWRTKFYAPCNSDANVDMEVEPGKMTLRYQIERMYNVMTYEAYWQLKIYNPDGSFFVYYKP